MSELQIFDCEQGSDEWFAVKLGIPSASMFKAVLAEGKGATRRAYMMRLIAEELTGQRVETYKNDDMDRGNQLEPEVIDLYRVITGAEITRIGFMRRDRIGCSPDMLISTNGMAQIKTSRGDLHCEILLADQVPTTHKAQLQGELMVSAREWNDYVNYCRGLPPFIKRVYRDESYIAKLTVALDEFCDEMESTKQRIRSMA